MNLHIHYGAGIDTVTVNGVTFDRSKLTKEERHKMAFEVVCAFREEQAAQATQKKAA